MSRVLAAAALCFIACVTEMGIESPDERVHFSPSAPFGSSRDPIVNGYEAPAYTWNVRLVTERARGCLGTKRSLCSGTLIAERWVLTAAHCDLPTAVYIGGSAADSGVLRKVRSQHAPSDGGDIRLLELDRAVDLQPLRVNTHSDLPEEYEFSRRNTAPRNVSFVGWGRTSHDGDAADRLLQVDVPALAECSERDMVCAGRSDVGACHGDSGGSLVARTDDGLMLVGVISNGTVPCAAHDAATLSVRVSRYVEWLRRVGVPID